jgi:peptidoglycan-associated lipoprotein
MSLKRQSFVVQLLAIALIGTFFSCGGSKRGPATGEIPPTLSSPEPEPPAEESVETPEPDPIPDEDTLSMMDEESDILSQSLDELNADSPLADILFGYDSAVLTPEARSRLESHAQWLRRFSSVTVLVEGHCDERGTVEYNLALGERRAMAAYNYLQSLGVPATRLKTISYGKEFPLDPGHNESAWARNRRCHFVITSK